MSNIIHVETEFPEYRYSQTEIMGLVKKIWPDHEAVIDRLAKTSSVDFRNTVVPLESYAQLGGFKNRNDIYIKSMMQILEKAIFKLQEATNFDWKDIGLITSTTITGVAVPSLEARLMNKFPFLRNTIRTPLMGLGCLGGVATLNRTRDLLRAHPNKLALVLAAEACSLTFQFDDVTMSNMVATSLFGDGCAAALLAGEDHPLAQKAKLEILQTSASFYPDTERIMGWDMVDSGFKVVLSGNVPEIVNKYMGEDVQQFLSKNHLKLTDINNIISHPGGPKVLQALAKVLNKEDAMFNHSWQSLRDQGNLSSVSVLNVMERSLKQNTLHKGHALMMAMGPAFNSEMSLLKVL